MIILPKPKKVTEYWGSFLADFEMKIVSISEELMPQKGWALPSVLKDYLLKWAGVKAELSSAKAFRGDIILEINKDLSEEEYKLSIIPENIRIEGGSRMGVGHGISTLCQLIKLEGGFIPCLEIEDYPDLPSRGYYLDQARGRSLKLESLKAIVDDLRLYKINQFQLYIEQTFLFRGFSEMWREDSVLSPSEILELDRYCRERDIDLVPSLASFGHLYGLLRTKSYESFCEMEESSATPFSLIGKLHHHTIDVSNEASFRLIEELFNQFLPLFSSKYVNICADETFDLGRGRSQGLAKEKGTERLYVDFLKKLCNYVVDRGKIPQFWGDIINKEPELMKELPKETICLAWGYDSEQKDDICDKIAKTGAKLYLCPGVSSWNLHIPDYEGSFKNIKLMSSYAKKYSAIGLLNTDWGDFGHINDVKLSLPGMIYGASFGWNTLDEAGEEEMNREISELHYTDRSKSLVNELKKASKNQVFDWWMTVAVFEKFMEEGKFDEEKQPLEYKLHKTLIKRTESFKTMEAEIDKANENLEVIRISMRRTFNEMDSSHREELEAFNHALWAASVWNRVGKAMFIEGSYDEEGKKKLAGELEFWFMLYKNLYRKSSKEGLLHRIGRIVFWYADRLRGLTWSEWEFQRRGK